MEFGAEGNFSTRMLRLLYISMIWSLIPLFFTNADDEKGNYYMYLLNILTLKNVEHPVCGPTGHFCLL